MAHALGCCLCRMMGKAQEKKSLSNKKYRNPLEECGMYGKYFLFVRWRATARFLSFWLHAIPLWGQADRDHHLSPN